MLFRCLSRLTLFALACGLIASPCYATDYNEAVSGDLSSNRLTPTSIGALTLGSNLVIGTTGRQGDVVDRDYFTFSVPTGLALSSLTVLPDTQAGNVSFIGLQGGSHITLPPTTTTAAGLLGWWHYSPNDINTDILPTMGIPARGSSGFTPPLAAGTYAIWLQDSSPGTFNYGFNFGVVAVPEPGSLALLMGSGLSLGLFGLSRRARRRNRA